MSIHRSLLARLAVAAFVAVLGASAARAGSLSDLLREYRDAGDASVDAGPPLAADEAARIWDAFLTAIVKRAGRDAAGETLRDDLFASLLTDRYGVVGQALDGDGARWLSDHFEEAWPRIEPALSRVAMELPPAQANAYRELVQGGNLLAAARSHGLVGKDGVAPARLRVLAQKIVPAAEGDPIAWSAAVDPELRAVFGFDADLPEPLVSPLLPEASPTAFLASPLALVARMAAGAADWLVPTAHAAASGWDWHTIVTRLNDWVPNGKNELREYLPMVQEMLDGTAHTLADRRLPPEHFEVYRDLVVATAWQESCWRQYTKKGDRVATVVGPGPSYGLMQVNSRVWRGIYDAKGVSTDIGYNGRAGAEILYQYMRKHAIRGKEHMAPGGETNLARATYAAYNGGPGHLRRYRKPDTSARLRAVDNEFFQKFQAVENENESAFFSCAVKG
jgi:hypothetical protein